MVAVLHENESSESALRAAVISDLHMFSRRSEFESHLPAIHGAADRANIFVFNGDTFDFKWTTLPSVEETVENAILWLAELCEQFPNTEFHFILGNHDNLQLFIDQLSALSQQTENLSWHPYYLRLGDVVFLHGDVCDAPMDAAELKRRREQWLHDHKTRPTVYHNIYDWVLRLNVHLAIQRIAYPKRRVAQRIITYLEDVGLGRLDGIRHVVFGHTHGAMQDFEHSGLMFHNPGTPMKGMEFNVLELDVRDIED